MISCLATKAKQVVISAEQIRPKVNDIMAKQRNGKKSKKQIRPARRSNRVRNGSGTSNSPIAKYARMLDDPCNAETVTGIYPGEIGVVQRTLADFTAGAALQTCGYVMYWPAVNAVDTNGAALSSVALAHTWTVAPPFSPGHAYLTQIASKSRCLGACLAVSPASLSLTNIVGEWTVGCVSSDAVITGAGAVTVDQLFNVLSLKTLIQRKPAEVKFTPGVFDSKYQSYGVAASADISDTNIVIIAWRGVPAGTILSTRITSILEYTTKSSATLGVSAVATSGGINHLAVTSALHKSKPNWFHNLWDNVTEDAGQAARYVARTALYKGAQRAGSYILGAAESELPMLLAAM